MGFLFTDQFTHARGTLPLIVHSPSFRLRALPFVQESGRQAYRHKLSYATPDFRDLYPSNYYVQSGTDRKCWDLLRTALVACASWECNHTKHDREAVYTSYQCVSFVRCAKHMESAVANLHGSLSLVSRNRDDLSPGYAGYYFCGA